MFQRYLTFIVRHRSIVILVALSISALFFFKIGNLRVVVDPDTNLPQDHPYVVATNKIERVFGGRNVVIIGLEPSSGDVFQPTVLEKLQRITDGILNIPGVIRSNVISLAARKAKNIVGTDEGLLVHPLMEAVPRTPDEIARLRAAVYANPIYVDSIVSKSGRMALVIADFRFGKDLPGYRPIKEQVEAVVSRERDETVRIYLGGISINLAWLEIYSQRMLYLFFISLAVIMGVLYFSFRSVQGMAIPVVTALMSVVWGLGLMGLLNVPMDTFNVTTPILIMAVAAGHSVQILKRYYEEYGKLHDSRAAVIASLSKIGPVMLTAGTIAVVSFLSLILFPTLTIQIFGIFTAMGILSALILEMTFIPALRSFLGAPRRYEMEREQVKDWLDRFTNGVTRLIINKRWGLLFGTWAGLFLGLLSGIPLLVVDNSLKGNFSPASTVRQDDIPLNQGMGGTNTLYLLIEGPEPDAMKNPAALKAMDTVQRYLERRYALVGKSQSLADFLKRMNKAMHADDPKEDRLPDTRELTAQYLLLYSVSGDPGDFDTYVDYDYKAAVIWAYLKTDSTFYIEQVIADLRSVTAREFPPDYKISIGGGMAQGAALNEVMVKGKLLNIVCIAASIYLISSLMLRSALAGLLVLIPLVLAVIANFGVMGLTGIRLDIGTSAVSAMAVGVGADYAIYLIYRMREEIHARGNCEEAVRVTLATAGKAVIYVALAVGLGYSILMFTGFGIHIRLGFLVAVAMGVSCLSAISVVPAAICLIRPSFAFQPNSPFQAEVEVKAEAEAEA